VTRAVFRERLVESQGIRAERDRERADTAASLEREVADRRAAQQRLAGLNEHLLRQDHNKETVSRLFDLDMHAPTPGTAREEGTGLGLVICRQVVERLGETISAVSKPDGNSRFTVGLPEPHVVGTEAQEMLAD
jgi:hypothetical protein